MSVPISAIPEQQRPRERLLAQGEAALSDAELVAILLGSGRRGENSVNVAQCLLAEYGGVNGLSRARPEELAARSGVGVAKATRLVAAFALAVRVTGSPHGIVVRASADVATVVAPFLVRARRERVVAVVCDAGNRVRHISSVAEGAVDRSPVPVREVLTTVLQHDGRAFAIAHNHPGGDVSASEADNRTTQALRNAAEAVGLRFLDHVIVAGQRWASII